MSANVFADSSGSESDRPAKSRGAVPQYLLAPSASLAGPSGAQAHNSEDSADDVDGGGGDDDEELSRLRGSEAYGLFSEKYKTKDRKLENERRRAAREAEADVVAARVRDARRGDDDDDEQDIVPSSDVALPTRVEGLDELGTRNDVARGGRANPNSTSRNSDPSSGLEKSQRPRRALDPKILDDSSDDESGGGGSSEDDVAIGPAAPPARSSAEGGSGFRGGNDGEDALPSRLSSLPLTHEASFGTKHEAQVCAISLDTAGSRLLTASSESTLCLWDFGTMNSALRSFRSVEPLDSGPIASARFSASGGRILCAGNLRVARVFDRDARPLVETIPGDMYIVDMTRTKGHTAPLNDAQWLSNGSDQRVATIAGDSTLRIWDIASATAPVSAFDGELSRARQIKVVKLRNQRGGKTSATAMAVLSASRNGESRGGGGVPRVALGCDDGSIKVIEPEAFSARPVSVNTCVLPGSSVSALAYCEGAGHGTPLLLSRSTDDALRAFDLRRFDKPLVEHFGLPNDAPQTGVSFMGPGGSFFFTGTSANRRGGTECARLVVYDAQTLEMAWESSIDRERGSVVAVAWHERINQMLYGCADGSTHVMYNPETSRAGVLQCIVKKEKRKQQHGMASIAAGEIYTPNALPMFRDKTAPGIAGGSARGQSRRKREAAQIPLPNDAPDEASMTKTFTQAFKKSKVNATWTEDPREALLRYHDPAADEGKAKPILAEKTREEEEAEEMIELMAHNERAQKDGSAKK